MKPLRSLTVRRRGRNSYQLTFWTEGVGRFDGRTGSKLGAWHSHLGCDLVEMVGDQVERLPRKSPPSEESKWSLAVERDNGACKVFGVDSTPSRSPGWAIVLLLEGLRTAAAWAPLDTREGENWGAWSEATTVRMCTTKVMATALARPEGLVVLSGSVGSTATSATVEKPYRLTRERLRDEGVLVIEGDRYLLTQHVRFGTPSAAASVLAGSNTNGRQAWRDSRGVPASELELDGA